MGRAGICSLIHVAEENDMGGDEVLQKADEIGLDWAVSSIGGYFEKFANQRKRTGTS